MFNLNIKEILIELINKYKSKYIANVIMSNKNKDLYNEILNQTQFLWQNVKLSERIYCIIKGIETIQVCNECKVKRVKYDTFENWYRKFCSAKCSANNIETKNKRVNTNIERYWVINPFSSEEIKKKIKKTNIKRYNVSNPMFSEKIKKKLIQTNILRYWIKNVFERKDIILKNKERIKKIRIEKQYNYYLKEINKNLNNNITKELFAELWVYWPYSFICKKCWNLIKDKFIYNHKSKRFAKCYNCFPIITSIISKQEKDIIKYIKKLNNIFKLIQNDRNILDWKELDIYLPEIWIAIEYNGLIWHSIWKSKYNKFNNINLNIKFKYRHKYKTDQCLKKNIQLFHIFENEWLDENKQKIWKNILKERININNFNNMSKNNTKTTINLISKQLSDDFLNMYHLEWKIENKGNFINIWIFDWKEDNLLFVLVIEILENNKFKIIRYWTNYNIDNKNFNSDKLLKQSFNYFLENYIKEKNIKDYNIQAIVNLRWTYWKELEQLWFKIIKQTNPNYFYFLSNENILYDKNHDKIKNKSENELFNLWFRKIYDSWNIILEYKY